MPAGVCLRGNFGVCRPVSSLDGRVPVGCRRVEALVGFVSIVGLQ